MPEHEVSSRIRNIVVEDEDGKKIRIEDDREGSMPKWLLPIVTALAVALATGAFTFAWSVSRDMAVLKAQQAVNPVEFAQVKTELLQTEKDLERLRTWMTNHVNRAHTDPPLAPPQ